MTSLELYHGSPTGNIETLRLPEAKSRADSDGIEIPKIYASSDIDYAIFMAVIGGRRWGGWDGRQYGGKGFYIYEEFAESLGNSYYQGPTGTVYLLDSGSFVSNRGHEWTSEASVRVLGSIAVDIQDLPPFTISPEMHPYHFRKVS